jgi:hypothetical protein
MCDPISFRFSLTFAVFLEFRWSGLARFFMGYSDTILRSDAAGIVPVFAHGHNAWVIYYLRYMLGISKVKNVKIKKPSLLLLLFYL